MGQCQFWSLESLRKLVARGGKAVICATDPSGGAFVVVVVVVDVVVVVIV